jgi:DNA-binding LacI/PurR family transcriptional regulator
MLIRAPNGRVIADVNAGDRMRIAFLVPSAASPDVESRRLHIERIAARAYASVRTILYLHRDDPAVVDALESFEGVYVYPSCGPMPVWIIDRLREAGRAVTVLGRDLTAHGIRSVEPLPARLHPAAAGLRRQPRSSRGRLLQRADDPPRDRAAHRTVELWRAVHRMGGRRLGEPISAYDVPLGHAYAQAGRLLDDNQFTASAVFCTTMPAAIGVMRAMRDRGIREGADKSVFVFNDEGMGRYMSPSLTSVELPSPDAYLALCMEWVKHTGEGWIGPLLMQPSDAPLIIGGSTGPCIANDAQK